MWGLEGRAGGPEPLPSWPSGGGPTLDVTPAVPTRGSRGRGRESAEGLCRAQKAQRTCPRGRPEPAELLPGRTEGRQGSKAALQPGPIPGAARQEKGEGSGWIRPRRAHGG